MDFSELTGQLLFTDLAELVALCTRFLAPLLAVILLLRCLRSMLNERYDSETWAYLYLPGEIMVPLNHWENIIGSGAGSDARITEPAVAKLHACLMRNSKGKWVVYPLNHSHLQVNDTPADEKGLPIADADVLTLGTLPCRFVDLTEAERAALLQHRHAPGRHIRPAGNFFWLTLFQAVLCLQQFVLNPDSNLLIPTVFAALCGLEWAYFFIFRGFGSTGFEADTLAFFLSSLGLSVACSSTPDSVMKELFLIAAGLLCFIFLSLWTRDLNRMKKLVWPMGVIALILLAATLLLAEVTNGAQNWIRIGGFSLQPSEFVKICYIYAGATTLDRMFVNRNLILFIGFSAACVGCLALMGDFGTALIFFITFLIISFMRSGSFATGFLAVGAAVIACLFIFSVKPYIAARFSTWGHVWDDVYGSGWQQARAMCAAASGGLFGQGAGRGWLVDVFAADTDMVWAVLCEEQGLIIALCAIAAVLALVFFVVRNVAGNRSGYYAIAACAAVSMMTFQMALNVFGTMDILPFTGVTFPFVSQGGSSLLCCWMLMAFVKAADTRANASFAVKRPERFSGGAGVPQSDEDSPYEPSYRDAEPAEFYRDTDYEEDGDFYDSEEEESFEWIKEDGGDME